MSVSPRILVTGATGHIGREVVAQLLAADVAVRALTRDPQSSTLPEEVEAVRGDLAAPDTLDRALDGVDAVFLVWVAPLAAAADAIGRIASHVDRIVFVSAPIHTAHPFFQQPNAMRSLHADLERLIEQSGMRSTILRAGPFAINCRNWWAPQIRTGNVVRWFCGEAQTAAVHERDVAAVAVRALCDARLGARDCVLTGPESLTQREQLAIIGDAIGRTLVFEEVSAETARRELVAPEWLADMLLSAYAAAVGRAALVTSDVEMLTGRPPRTFRQWAADHASDFTAGSD